jgi:hypothetical protein
MAHEHLDLAGLKTVIYGEAWAAFRYSPPWATGKLTFAEFMAIHNASKHAFDAGDRATLEKLLDQVRSPSDKQEVSDD